MRKVGFLLMIALLLALVPAVLAGGWAVITLDDMPGEIRAGEPWTVGFTVLQHGQTPVHRLNDGYGDGTPIEPTLIATNPDTGERVEATAEPTKEVGHFTLEVTFPSEGAWEWTIEPAPLAGETQFEPLTVLPAAVAPVEPAAQVEPVVKSLVVEEPAEAVAPTAPDAAPAASTVDGGFPTSAALRWGALIVALVAAALFLIQSRRRSRPAGVES